MRKSVIQILQVLLILVLVLSIPLFIEFLSGKKGNGTPEITSVSAYTSQTNVGTQTNNNSDKKNYIFQTPYTIYAISLLFIISIISFLTHKTKHKKHG